MSNYSFADLRQILLDLGFQMKLVPGSHIVFEHDPAHARLVLEPFADGEKVDLATLAVVGRNLDERGILPRARFEELLRERALAG
jgi:predicted RNA binding protein YcfA (HicA-like mRNA interferase family)